MKIKTILLIVSLVCIVGLILLALPDEELELEDKSIPFSEQPDQFVDVYQNGLTFIDISYITNYNSVVEDEYQVYTFGENNYTHFKTEIVYNGDLYLDSVTMANGQSLRVSSNMTPGDDIIEGYIVQKINEYATRDISTYIFVDEDWKQAYPQTYIHWGALYERTIPFAYTQVSEGVYMTKITDDPERFLIGLGVSQGGILVGPLTREDVDNRNVNVTAMRLR